MHSSSPFNLNYFWSNWLWWTVAALIPAIPIAVAIAGAIPDGITVILRFAKLQEKRLVIKDNCAVFNNCLRKPIL